MKTTTKNLILGLVLLVGSEATAFPVTHGLEGTFIECSSLNSPSHKLSLLLEQESNAKAPFVFDTNYEALFHSFYGPRLVGYEYKVIAKVSRIMTRVLVGKSYKAEVPGVGELIIDDFEYSADPSRFPSGFAGVFKSSSGTEIDLTCKYLN